MVNYSLIHLVKSKHRKPIENFLRIYLYTYRQMVRFTKGHQKTKRKKKMEKKNFFVGIMHD